MKVRESGMPDETMWDGFFDAEQILRTFGLDREVVDLVEFGCGYGTFTLAAARMVTGIVHALDIEPGLIGLVGGKCRHAGLANVRAVVRDFVGQGSGLSDQTVDAALLFNILHHDQPVALLAEAGRVLKPGGICAVIHWNYDPTTPRGPALEIRPRPEQCIAWGQEAGFLFDAAQRFDLPPYHYGLLFKKPVPLSPTVQTGEPTAWSSGLQS